MNIERVAQVAAQECIRQEVGLQELAWLIDAYQSVARIRRPYRAFRTGFDIKCLGRDVEPRKNREGFRRTPVTFRSGGSAAAAPEIPRLIDTLVDNMYQGEPAEVVKQFLWIHPFVDGNGRSAWILWNHLNGTMDEPTNLPDFFGENA